MRGAYFSDRYANGRSASNANLILVNDQTDGSSHNSEIVLTWNGLVGGDKELTGPCLTTVDMWLIRRRYYGAI